MKDKPVPINALPGDFIAADDEGLFAFIDSLRGSVRAKVAAGQRRGLSLAEIVVEVREMVRFAEEDPDLPTAFSSHAYRAISRQAVAWCIEAYHPAVFTANELTADAMAWNENIELQLLAVSPDIATAVPPAGLPVK